MYFVSIVACYQRDKLNLPKISEEVADKVFQILIKMFTKIIGQLLMHDHQPHTPKFISQEIFKSFLLL